MKPGKGSSCRNGAVLAAISLAVALVWFNLIPAQSSDKVRSQSQTQQSKKYSGSALVDKSGCANCHIIKGQGGTIAPPLDGIGAHRDLAYILQRLTGKGLTAHTQYPVPQELMSHVRVPEKQAEAIAEYLLKLPERPGEVSVKGHGTALSDALPPGSHFEPLPPSESTERGARLYKAGGCAACHAIGSVGGHIGPNLAGVGARRSKDYIQERITQGAVLLPKPGAAATKYSMPPAKLSQKEVADLTNFLLTLPAKQK